MSQKICYSIWASNHFHARIHRILNLQREKKDFFQLFEEFQELWAIFNYRHRNAAIILIRFEFIHKSTHPSKLLWVKFIVKMRKHRIFDVFNIASLRRKICSNIRLSSWNSRSWFLSPDEWFDEWFVSYRFVCTLEGKRNKTQFVHFTHLNFSENAWNIYDNFLVVCLERVRENEKKLVTQGENLERWAVSSLLVTHLHV